MNNEVNYRIAICDDEKLHIEKIREFLADLETDSFTSSKALLEKIKNGKAYDVLFLDIAIPDIDGISLAREIREIDEKVIIVFITSKIEFLQVGYEVRAFRYLLKNQLSEGLPKIWRDIERELMKRKDEFFTFEFERQRFRYNCREIIYFESHMRRIILHTKSETVTFYGKLDEIEAKYHQFVRIHKSFLVNHSYIRAFSAGTAILLDGNILPISRKYEPNFEVIK